ncbi:uncharacterized protein LOC101901223 isoform X2 [Musca domestica]|uniref:Uncharacterized protein LOC101901223 isoform X2 n=1 Tax=Musca domestica TaxID=7370 RepID=A0A1I8NEP3_MUSDO|nr:uncharacterized protein LOC101901223 isoform X2 [Musca domestica]
MDLYEEKEEIISSDEYSEDDDDDGLMNDAIRAQGYKIPAPHHDDKNESPKWQNDKKQKQLSSLIRRNKISVIYKNKSIKWLNNKKNRERYKCHIAKNCIENKKIDADDIVCLGGDGEIFGNLAKNISMENKMPKHTQLDTKNLSEKSAVNIDVSNEVSETKHTNTQSSQTEFVEKRARSSSPNENEYVGEYRTHEKRYKTDDSQFYKHINETFPTYNEIAKRHIEHLVNNNITSIDNKMKSISQEIKTLNEILYTKETEWNRILHLKIVKEELYSRLSRKKHSIDMKETLSKSRRQNSVLELKELESYLSDKDPTPNSRNTSIQQIIENRANMKSEDLKRERSSTSRLHSLLVSRNMLPDANTTEARAYGNGNVHEMANFETYEHLPSGNAIYRERGELKDVKSIINDFKQKKSEIISQDKKKQQHLQIIEASKSDNYHSREFLEDAALFTSIGKEHDKGNNVSLPKNNQYPYCQECKIHESRFVCAGCGNQWYCSKKCQISAWDKHSEICTD